MLKIKWKGEITHDKSCLLDYYNFRLVVEEGESVLMFFLIFKLIIVKNFLFKLQLKERKLLIFTTMANGLA